MKLLLITGFILIGALAGNKRAECVNCPLSGQLCQQDYQCKQTYGCPANYCAKSAYSTYGTCTSSGY